MLRSYSHLTDACDHENDKWCKHCEEGCTICGALDDLDQDDESYCSKCALDRAIMAAESLYEGDR